MDPTLADSLARALALHGVGQLAQAEAIYRDLLARDPNQPTALHYLGVIAHQTGQHDVAINLIRRAIEAGDATPLAQVHLAEALRPLGRLDDAIGAAARAIAIDRTCADGYAILGLVQLDRGRAGEAIPAFESAIRLRPSFPVDHNNLGVALERVGDDTRAADAYRRAVELDSAFTGAMTNLGTVLHRLGRRDEAAELWQRALTLDPADRQARWNLGTHSMATGDYARGWPIYRERREAEWPQYVRHYPGKPHWDGSPLDGRRILLYPEQGFGDVIQFARFIPHVRRRGGQVLLVCQRELLDLMRTVAGVDDVIADGDPLPPFDCYHALFTLPMLLGVTPADLPGPVPYVAADPAKAADLASQFADRPRPWVGLTWAGEPRPDPNRTCPLASLSPVLDVCGPTFFSLQKGQASAVDRLIDLAPRLNSFADTAAAMRNLDLMVTIDSAPAHLAGALGVRTCTLLPFDPDWRWMHDRDDCPWYPSMRLFRQRTRGDWSDPVARVRDFIATEVRA